MLLVTKLGDEVMAVPPLMVICYELYLSFYDIRASIIAETRTSIQLESEVASQIQSRSRIVQWNVQEEQNEDIQPEREYVTRSRRRSRDRRQVSAHLMARWRM